MIKFEQKLPQAHWSVSDTKSSKFWIHQTQNLNYKNSCVKMKKFWFYLSIDHNTSLQISSFSIRVIKAVYLHNITIL